MNKRTKIFICGLVVVCFLFVIGKVNAGPVYQVNITISMPAKVGNMLLI